MGATDFARHVSRPKTAEPNRTTGHGKDGSKSVDIENSRHFPRIAASEACFASIAATASLPNGMRTGGSATSANSTSCRANFSGSPGWLWSRLIVHWLPS